MIGLVMTAQTMFEPDDSDFDDMSQYKRPVIIATIVGLINYFSSNNQVNLSPIMLVVMLTIFGYLCYWWKEESSEFREIIPFIIMVVILFFVTKATALMAATLVPDFAGIIVALPTIAMVASIGFFVFNLFKFKYEYGIGPEKQNYIASMASAVLSLLLVVSVTASAIGGQGFININDKSFVASNDGDIGNVEESNAVLNDIDAFGGSEVDTGTVKQTVSTGWGAHYYNDDLQDDGKAENDFNFGPNPWVDGKDFDYYHQNFAQRRAKDPVLLASTCIALDCTFGTDLIGEILYEGYDEKLNVLERADAAAKILNENETLHNSVNSAVNKFLSSAKRREMKQMIDIGDQLFMNPSTISGIPGIVFYETEFEKGWCLVYTFQMKSGSNTEEHVVFHIPCGYQWCNATEKIDVEPETKPVTPEKTPEKTPEEKPKKKEKPKEKEKPKKEKKKKEKKKEKKKKEDKGDSSSYKKKKEKKTEEVVHYREPQKPSYDKDPSKAPKKNTEPNDDKGPGPNTNSGGDKSSKEKKENSNNKSSYKEYKEDIQKKKDTNETQKKSGDSNKPSSTPKKEPAKVDNNGDKGTGGNGGADKPTPKKEKAKEASSGKEINDKPGEAWGGPSD